MTLNAALCYAILGLSLFLSRPGHGLMTILASDTASGKMARRLILAPVLIPLATGLVQSLGLRFHIYNPTVSSWSFAVLNILFFTAFIVWAASLLYRTEERHQIVFFVLVVWF